MASLSRLTRAALGTTAGVAGVAFVAYEQDEGVRRSMIFWSRVLPIYAHYRWLQYVELPARGIDNSSDECMRAYDVLHERYAPIVERSALELRGFYLKAAQLVSTRDDFVPPAYLVWCKRMQAEVPTPFRPGEGRRIVEKALGGAEEFARTFAHWEEQPCGSASIGVVHRARLAGDGREVAVKVMMPGIESKFRSDLGTIRRFCALAMPQHVSGLDEIDAQFFTEFDYTLEARSMETIHDNLARTRWTKKVVVPRPVPELCSQHVLVMEYLPGVKLDDGLRAQWSRVAERRGVSLDKLEAIERSRPPRELSDSHWRHLAVRLWLRIFDLAANAPRLAFNWTVGALVGVRLRTEWTEVPIDLAAVIRTICDVHAHELFVDGCFNGAPAAAPSPARYLSEPGARRSHAAPRPHPAHPRHSVLVGCTDAQATPTPATSCCSPTGASGWSTTGR